MVENHLLVFQASLKCDKKIATHLQTGEVQVAGCRGHSGTPGEKTELRVGLFKIYEKISPRASTNPVLESGGRKQSGALNIFLQSAWQKKRVIYFHAFPGTFNSFIKSALYFRTFPDSATTVTPETHCAFLHLELFKKSLAKTCPLLPHFPRPFFCSFQQSSPAI